MVAQVRIADGFKRQSADQLITSAGGIITGVYDSGVLTSAPPIDRKTVETAVEDLKAALAAQVHGGPAATAEKNNKQEALIAVLRKLKHHVLDNCGNDPAVVLATGFRVAATTRSSAPLDAPSILSVEPGNSTELVLKVKAVARVKCYEVQSAVALSGNAPSDWKSAGLFTNSRSIKVGGLTPGTTYAFRVRAVGGSTTYSDWSNPVSRICW